MPAQGRPADKIRYLLGVAATRRDRPQERPMSHVFELARRDGASYLFFLVLIALTFLV